MNAPTRPIVRYHGGKWKLAPWIIAHFPPHRVYVEPFGGGGSVLMRKPRSNTEIYNDMDSAIIAVFRTLRDESTAKELARRMELTPFSREEYEQWCYEEPIDQIDHAHKLIARSFMGQSSKGIWQRSGFDTRVNDDGFCSRVNALAAASDTVRQFAERLSGVVVEHDDAIEIIKRHDSAGTLFYVDPPYVMSTRNTKIYKHDMSDDQHRGLAAVLKNLQGMVILSGYRCPLYDELYAGWDRLDRAAHADGARDRVESLWLSPNVQANQMRMPL